MPDMEIACPKCSWKPDGKPYWECDCGHVWDTFSTLGRCPACKKVWDETQCPKSWPVLNWLVAGPSGCGCWSKHLDWYRISGNQIEELENLNQAGKSELLPIPNQGVQP
jgi:hypothetical protein